MTEMFFATQKNGYDKADVEKYIDKLTKAYQTAYDSYQNICGKYNELVEDYNDMENTKRSGSNFEAISKTLLDAELLAEKIVGNAQTEADRVVEQTRKSLEQICQTMEQATREVHKLARFQYLDTREVRGEIAEKEETGGMLNDSEDIAGTGPRVYGGAHNDSSRFRDREYEEKGPLRRFEM